MISIWKTTTKKRSSDYMIAGLSNNAWLRLDPPHPGRSTYHGCLAGNGDDYKGMTIGEAADKLGINRVTLSRVVNGHARITTGLALKLEAAGRGAANSRDPTATGCSPD